MKKQYQVKDVFVPYYEDTSKGIFYYIYNTDTTNIKWYNASLDLGYLYDNSYEKIITKFVERICNNVTEITEAEITKIANYVAMRYLDKWNKLYEALVLEPYNPIENYNMEEVKTPRVITSIHKEVNTTVETSNEVSQELGTYGLNSTKSKPTSTSEGDSTQTVSGLAKDNYSDEETSYDGIDTLTRKGNIGVTTTQDMLMKEIELKRHNFYQIMFDDLDEIITLGVYKIDF